MAITLMSLGLNNFWVQLDSKDNSVGVGIREICQNWMHSSPGQLYWDNAYKIYIELVDANTILVHSRNIGFIGYILNLDCLQSQKISYPATTDTFEIVLSLGDLRVATKSDLLEYII